METIVLDEASFKQHDRDEITDRLIECLLDKDINLGSFKFTVTVDYEEGRWVQNGTISS